MTGSDEFPLRIGKNVTIKGTSYLFGSIVEDDVFIEHSILVKKKIDRACMLYVGELRNKESLSIKSADCVTLDFQISHLQK